MKMIWCSIGLALMAQACSAQSDDAAVPGDSMRGPREIFSCVGGPSITLGPNDGRALLDDSEREALLAEMIARYPMLERDGFSPAAIILWRKGKDWLYVSLRPNGFRSNVLCFTATFVAKMFQITPALTSKYFFEGTEKT